MNRGRRQTAVPTLAAAVQQQGSGLAATVILVLFVLACGGGGGGSPTEPPPATPEPIMIVAVQFEYDAPTQIEDGIDFSTCNPNGGVFTTHLHLSWRDWEDRVYMSTQGPDRFVETLPAPVGRDLSVALHDPNTCTRRADPYVAPDTLSANGVPLREVVPVVVGTGVRFRVAADGTVTP